MPAFKHVSRRQRDQQRLAARGGLEGQFEEGGKILAQGGVARQQGIEQTSLLEPGEGAAGGGRLAQSGRIKPNAQASGSFVRSGGEQGVDGAEHGVQPIAGRPSEIAMAHLDGVAGRAVHGGQKLIMHGNGLVQHGLAGLNQVAGDQGVAFGFGKTSKVAGVIAATQLSELADDPWVGRLKAGAIGQ